jgi:CRP/FNR family cyclic AMP-dependent transcriptional regulator
MAADPTIVDALGATDLFGGLNRRTIKKLAEQMKLITHEDGKQLITEGEGGIAFHLIIDGTADVAVGSRASRQLSKGDYFGEISMIDGQPRSATVTANTGLVTAAMSAWNFRPFLTEEPDVVRELLLTRCRRLRESESSQSASA